jgi:hypothetical protein
VLFLFVFTYLIFLFAGCHQSSENRIVKIKDGSPEKLVRYTLDKPKGNMYENEMKTITSLSYGKNRSMLMSYTNKKLIELEKQMGDSIDLTELKYMPNLKSIDFFGIKVEHIEALLNKPSLTRLSLWETGNSDISVVGDLINLSTKLNKINGTTFEIEYYDNSVPAKFHDFYSWESKHFVLVKSQKTAQKEALTGSIQGENKQYTYIKYSKPEERFMQFPNTGTQIKGYI